VPGELPDELLPHHAGGPENPHVDALELHDAPPEKSKRNQKKTRRPA
jgi:hypothetical protein